MPLAELADAVRVQRLDRGYVEMRTHDPVLVEHSGRLLDPSGGQAAGDDRHVTIAGELDGFANAKSLVW